MAHDAAVVFDLAIGPPAPVQICQLEAELGPVLDLYRSVKPSHVLEIGTASGGSLYHWLINAPQGAAVVTVDLPEPEYPLEPSQCHEWAPEGVELVMIRGDSHAQETLAEVSLHGPFEWIFIDGSHRYEDAVADVRDYSSLAAPGALLLLHDISLERTYEDGTEAGVGRLWREIQASGLWTREYRAHPDLREYGIGACVLPADE